MTRSSVDLPLPLGPSSAVSDPLATSIETSSSATKSPKRFVTLRASIATRVLPRSNMSSRPASARRAPQGAQKPRRHSSAAKFSYDACTYCVSVCVRPSMPPETIATAPNSPRQRAIVSTTPYATAYRIAGSVIRRNVVNADAPSVTAASSCSVPISRSTGTTSRTTNGSETKMVARSIPGYANRIRWPCDVQPWAEPTVVPVEQVQRQADDDGRERHRQVDDRVHEAHAGYAVTHDRERAEDAERRVERHRDDRDLDRELERVHRVAACVIADQNVARSRARTRDRRSARPARARITAR